MSLLNYQSSNYITTLVMIEGFAYTVQLDLEE